jgi:hypothetical protein
MCRRKLSSDSLKVSEPEKVETSSSRPKYSTFRPVLHRLKTTSLSQFPDVRSSPGEKRSEETDVGICQQQQIGSNDKKVVSKEIIKLFWIINIIIY